MAVGARLYPHATLPPPRRVRRPRASSRAGRPRARELHDGRRPSPSEHGAEPDAWGRQDALGPRPEAVTHVGAIAGERVRWGHPGSRRLLTAGSPVRVLELEQIIEKAQVPSGGGETEPRTVPCCCRPPDGSPPGFPPAKSPGVRRIRGVLGALNRRHPDADDARVGWTAMGSSRRESRVD